MKIYISLALALWGISLNMTSQSWAAAPMVKIDGSSTVFPISEAVAEEFQASKKGQITVTVGTSGTGGGFKKLCRGEIDVQDASRPILKSELEACRANKIEFFELPVAFDAIVVAVNKKNDWIKGDSVSTEDLKKIWDPNSQGKLVTWKQIRPEWPDTPLKLYGPGADSGTFDYFSEAIVGKAKSLRGDFTASEDDNLLVQGVIGDKGALGYFGYSYFDANRNKLRALSVDAGKMGPKPGSVAPNPASVEDGSYFPLSRPLFIYVNATAAKRPEVKEFVNYYLTNVSKLSKQAGFVPLTNEAYKLVNENFAKNKVGSVFKGEQKIGLKVIDILKMEAAL